ncbi:hypothetical protein EG327_009371 [Venturia inaequalis]|uniref:Inhibitor of growth protein N-terminal histone-binding domain-containing protein n=1 Tax=Venturia inaequalis TaxID=5025 RepID=A0A8H3YTF0_VENIN|nr:hypothetical protein EG327_009371 [Venturia inaequalis]
MASNTAGRRQSTRQTKSTGVRNYYHRNRAIDSDAVHNESQPGFFPAITHFTEAIEVFPKEVVRHFSMLKEVEAKLHAPDEHLRRLADEIERLPPPQERTYPLVHSYFPSLSAQNSINGSRNGSIVGPSGFVPEGQDEIADYERQNLFYNMSLRIAVAAPVLDEKIALLSTANQTLARCLERMESSYIHIPEEVSDEARLGNPKHWAYVTDKETKKAPPERARREAANHGVNAILAADSEIAQRSETRREAVAARKNRAQHIDSDFDDKPPPKKGPGKGRKAAVDDAKSVGLGITNGVGGPNKKRKVTGGAGAAPMERSMSGALSGALRGGQGSPRETPEIGTAGTKKRANKPGPPPKRRNIGPQSPALASSPIVSSFAQKEIPQKPQNSRARQSSANALHATPVETLRGRPSSSSSNKPANGMAGLSAIEQLQASAAAAESPSLGPTIVPTETADTMKHEDAEIAEDATITEPAEPPVVVTTRAGRQSKTATPMSGTFPGDMAAGPRNRSARAQKEKDKDSVNHSHASSESGERISGRRKKVASAHNSNTPTALGCPSSTTNIEDIDPDTELPGVEQDEVIEQDGTIEQDETLELEEEGEGEGEVEGDEEGEAKWYCDDCKVKMGVAGSGVKRVRPASRRD